MKLLIYIEPTSYLMPLWQEIRACTSGAADIVFLEENLSQSWGFDLQLDPGATVLRGTRWEKFKTLRQLIKKNNIELVHLAGWGHPLLQAALMVSWLRGIPVTMETDTPLPVGLPVWKRVVKRLVYPLLFKVPAIFLPGGTRQAAYLRHYAVSTERIQVAQMTVDVKAIAAHADKIDTAGRSHVRVRWGLPLGAVVFLYVGRLEPHKGIQTLVNAFSMLRPVSVPVALLLVGDGSMRADLAKMALADRRICCTGRLSGTALLDVYAAADVFVLPSRFEPWGLVINEAMACGLPVIATDRVGCVDDLVIDGETGYVVSSESMDTLTSVMTKLCQDHILRDKMAHNSRSLIAGWTIEKEAEIIVNTWNRTLELQCAYLN